MTEKKIVLLSGDRPLVKEQREALAPHNVELKIASQPTEEVLIEEIKNVDILIPGSDVTVSRKVIEAGKKLKGIVKPATGYENIDIEAATEHGIYVTYLPNYAIASVAEHTFSLLLAVARRIRRADSLMRRGRYRKENWFSQPSEILGVELFKKTLGIIGLGKIGRAVAERAHAFNMQVLAYDPYVKKPTAQNYNVELGKLEELLQKSDFITIHTPLTSETEYLIGTQELQLMQPHCILVNVARGAVIDSNALYKSLKERWIDGAGIDVYEVEPPPEDHPLFNLDNVVLTPHVGWYTKEAVKRCELGAVKKAIRILQGKKPNNLINEQIHSTTEKNA